MKLTTATIIAAVASFLLSEPAQAQCNGRLAAATICGNSTGSSALPRSTSISSFTSNIAPAAGTTNRGISVTQSGPTANSQIGAALNYNYINVTADASNTSDGSFGTNALGVNLTTGGGNSHGARQAIEGIVARTVASAASNGNRNDVGVTGRCLAASADNGTNTGAGAAGACFGGNFVAELGAGASNYSELAGAEINVGMASGASARYRFGWSVVGYGLGQGATLDAAFEVGNLTGSVLWQNALILTSIHGAAPINTTGCVVCTDGTAQTIATGFDLGAYTVSGNFLNGPGGLFKVTGAGLATAVSYSIGANVALGVSGLNTFIAAPDGNARAFFGSTGNGTLFRNSTGTSFQDATGASTYASIVPTTGYTSELGMAIYSGTSIPAGGTAGGGYRFSSATNFGVFFGSGVPTLSAGQGSIYLRSDGLSYINTNGSTAWSVVIVSGGALGSPSSAGTIPAFTLGGTISGGGNQLNNIVIGTTTPLSGSFTTANATSFLLSGVTVFGTSGSNTFIAAADGNARAFFGNTGNASALRNSSGTLFQSSDGLTTYANILSTSAFFTGTVQTGVTVVGSLPTCNTGAKGSRHFVTDANSTTFHATAAGGGANNVGVLCDGTNWYIN